MDINEKVLNIKGDFYKAMYFDLVKKYNQLADKSNKMRDDMQKMIIERNSVIQQLKDNGLKVVMK
jgi:hypothetical protein